MRSVRITSPSETTNCFPPVSITAYITSESYHRPWRTVNRSRGLRRGGSAGGPVVEPQRQAARRPSQSRRFGEIGREDPIAGELEPRAKLLRDLADDERVTDLDRAAGEYERVLVRELDQIVDTERSADQTLALRRERGGIEHHVTASQRA